MILKFKKYWSKFLMLVNKITILITFFGIVFSIISILYNFFYLENYAKVVIGCILAVTLIYSNLKIQGGN